MVRRPAAAPPPFRADGDYSRPDRVLAAAPGTWPRTLRS